MALKQIAPEIKIGSVEEYQGDVRQSTARFLQPLKYGYSGTSGHHHHDCQK
jgi:hypothetical protein